MNKNKFASREHAFRFHYCKRLKHFKFVSNSVLYYLGNFLFLKTNLLISYISVCDMYNQVLIHFIGSSSQCKLNRFTQLEYAIINAVEIVIPFSSFNSDVCLNFLNLSSSVFFEKLKSMFPSCNSWKTKL